MADSSLQLIILNLVLNWSLLVLIWLVQVIIYPGFDQIPSDIILWYVKRISLVFKI